MSRFYAGQLVIGEIRTHLGDGSDFALKKVGGKILPRLEAIQGIIESVRDVWELSVSCSG